MSITLRQNDTRWKNLSYPKGTTVGASGCGLISCCEIIVNVPKYQKYAKSPTGLVKAVRSYMLKHGYAIRGQGTAHNGITNCLKSFGFRMVKEFSSANQHGKVGGSAERNWRTEMQKGHSWGLLLFGTRIKKSQPVWTTGGHYIAVTAAKKVDGKEYYYLRDPGARHHDGWYPLSAIRGCVKHFWTARL